MRGHTACTPPGCHRRGIHAEPAKGTYLRDCNTHCKSGFLTSGRVLIRDTLKNSLKGN